MKKKNRLQKLVVLASALATMGVSTNIYAATYIAKASGDWGTNTNWAIDENGNGVIDATENDATVVPTATDDVVIPEGITVSNPATSPIAIAKNLTIRGALNDAEGVELSGNLSLLGTSALNAESIEFKTGSNTIDVGNSANLTTGTIIVPAGVTVTTSSDLKITDNLNVIGTFVATDGTITFNSSTAVCWNNNTSGSINLNNVDVIDAGATSTAFAPTAANISGNLKYNGAGSFTPAGEIYFKNPTQKNIQKVGDGTFSFTGLKVAPGATVVTNSALTMGGDLETEVGGKFIANGGKITFKEAGSKIISTDANAIAFNDLEISSTVTSSSDFIIKGNLSTTAAGLTATNTVTFENMQEKTITATNATDLKFKYLKIANGSKVKVGSDAPTASFTVENGGIEVEDNASLTINKAGVTTFSGTTNTIKNKGMLEFGELSNGSALTTTSDFTVKGAKFENTTGSSFKATDGTITFADGCTITPLGTDATTMQFNNIKVDASKATAAIELNVAAGKAMAINGDLTLVTETTGISATFEGADATAEVHFTGSKDQTIKSEGANKTESVVNFPTVTVNKTSGKLMLETNATLMASGALTLTEGVVDMGTTTLTSNVTPTKAAGAIDGAKGTYVVGTAQTLNDEIFTVDGKPTLNNLQADQVVTLGGDLTVNGNLDLNIADNVLGEHTLTVYGDMKRTTGTFKADGGKLVLTGSGKTTGFGDDYGIGKINLEVGRAEVLTNDLTMENGKTLFVNTGINYLDLAGNTLSTTTSGTLGIERISGAIDASASEVVLGPTSPFTLPGNLFKDNKVKDLTISNIMTLGGDLAITGTFTNTSNVITGENVLTMGPNSTTGTFTTVGKLRQTVTNSGKDFTIGNGDTNGEHNVTLKFDTPGTTQEMIVSANMTEPTVGRAGDPNKSIDLLYSIEPVGEDPKDKVDVTLGFGSTYGTGVAKQNIAAKWNGEEWEDYRNADAAASDAKAKGVASSTDLKGDWAVFNIGADYVDNDETNKKVDAAITDAEKRIVITSVTPNPVGVNDNIMVNVQLQDGLGQPIIAQEPVNVTITKKIGTAANIGDFSGVILPGSSFTTLTGMATSACANVFLQADDDNPDGYAPTMSEAFNVYGTEPTTATIIDECTPSNTSVTIKWTNADNNTLILLKAESTLADDGSENPAAGTSYEANSLYGAGSQIGDAVVVAKSEENAATQTASFRGLSPNTKYYVYAFAFTGENGIENYSDNGTSKFFTTGGSDDDDVAFGTNNTRETSRAIGTNTPIKGTIKSKGDEDWFNFSVNSTNPNVRAQLIGLPNNYNIEIYNAEGKRIRRGIRIAKGSEGPVINGLSAGTYTLKIYSPDGNSSSEPYTLKVGTKSAEIFSVTP